MRADCIENSHIDGRKAMSDGVNHQILLVERPAGKLGPQHFKKIEAAIPEPRDGEAFPHVSLD